MVPLAKIATAVLAFASLAGSAFADVQPYAAYSADGKHSMTIIEKSDGKKALVIDGKETAVTDVEENSYGYDSLGIPYYSRKDASGKFVFSFNGKDVATCDEPVTTSDMGKGIATFSCVKDGKLEIDIAGTKYGPFLKDGSVGYPTWNLTNTLFAYEVSEKAGETFYLLSNGRPLGKITGAKVSSLTFFGASGNVPAYVSSTAADFKGTVYFGNKSYGTFDGVYSFTASPDGKKLYYFAQKGEEYFLYLNGKVVKKGLKNSGYAYFSSKGKLFLSFETAKGWFVTVGSKTYGPFEEYAPYPSMDSDGTIWMMIVKKGGKYVGLVNGKEILP